MIITIICLQIIEKEHSAYIVVCSWPQHNNKKSTFGYTVLKAFTTLLKKDEDNPVFLNTEMD